MNPVCVKCQIELRPQHNGAVVVSMAEYGPHEMRRADVWHCPCCGLEIIHGLALKPELSGFEPAFAARLESYRLDPREKVIEYWANQRERELASQAPVAESKV